MISKILVYLCVREKEIYYDVSNGQVLVSLDVMLGKCCSGCVLLMVMFA